MCSDEGGLEPSLVGTQEASGGAHSALGKRGRLTRSPEYHGVGG